MDFRYKKTDAEFSLKKALTLEWLETNALGSYASSTIVNTHTRKYHGFLVANLKNPYGKYVLFSKSDDYLCVDGVGYPLSVHQYLGANVDRGFDLYAEFIQKSHPCFIYKFTVPIPLQNTSNQQSCSSKDEGQIELIKEVLLLHEENMVLIKYQLVNAPTNSECKIKTRPLIAARNFHDVTSENSCLNPVVTSFSANGKKITPYPSLPTLFFDIDTNCEFIPDAAWYKNFLYSKESERGFANTEDLFSMGTFIFNLNDKKQGVIFACKDNDDIGDLNLKWKNEIKRRSHVAKKAKGSPLQRQLQRTGQQFLQKNLIPGQYGSVVAGYHWFDVWGRDAMVALPGLTLYSGLEKECLEILKYFASQEQNGLIPNFIGKTPSENAYNSVDASLWFAWSVQQYYLHTKDVKSIAKYLWPTLKNIFHHYKIGTAYGIKMQADGLIYAGGNNEFANLTWMDANVNGRPVINRSGLQVEVNALWYNMLCTMENFAASVNDLIEHEIRSELEKVRTAFRATFWDEELGFLKDFVNPENPNDPMSLALRPNQIIAVSLPHSPISPRIMIKIVHAVHAHLLTPYGLRTLSPEDKNYCGTYQGNSTMRDNAYHNGTIWPWLIGHFTEALLKVLQNKKTVGKILKPCHEALSAHLKEYGISGIAEIFDGDYPHKPNGTINQAWSVAEFLRMTYLVGYRT